MRKLIILTVVLMFAGACGDTPPPNATATSAPSGDPAAFAQCMRGKGQDVPDPQPDTPWRLEAPREGNPAWEEAMRACRHLLPPQMIDKGPSPQELEQMRAFAVCMRAHDIDISDPITEGDQVGNMKIRGRFENVTRDQIEADPVYQAAYAACKDKLPSLEKKK